MYSVSGQGCCISSNDNGEQSSPFPTICTCTGSVLVVGAMIFCSKYFLNAAMV